MKTRGLTFLEVLLGVAMLALLLVGATTALYSFSRVFFTLETGPQFERHADGVTEFLHYLGSHSTTDQNGGTSGFDWKESPVSKSHTLSFQLDRDLPFFVSEFIPLPEVTAYLEFDEENNQFWLSWHVAPTFTNRSVRMRHSLLSPWGGDIEYGYYDEEQRTWEIEMASSDNRQKGNQRPNRLTLIFDRNDQILRREININQEGGASVLIY